MIQRGVVVIPKSVNPDRMAQIADLDSGESLFFEHTVPHMVRHLSG